MADKDPDKDKDKQDPKAPKAGGGKPGNGARNCTCFLGSKTIGIKNRNDFHNFHPILSPLVQAF